PLSFIVDEKEGPIFLDRPTESGAELVLPQDAQQRASARGHIPWHSTGARIGGGENALGVQSVVAEEVVRRAMKFVGATLGNDVDDATHRAAKLRTIHGVDNAKLLHRLLRRSSFLDSRSGGNIVCPVDGNEVVVDVLTGEGEFGDWLDDDV